MGRARRSTSLNSLIKSLAMTLRARFLFVPALAAVSALFACGSSSGVDTAPASDAGPAVERDGAAAPEKDAAVPADAGADGAIPSDDDALGFTDDFRAFLNTTGRDSYDFPRGDLDGDSAYGGRRTAGEMLTHEPVVFVHGNSDRGVGGKLEGWVHSIAAFRAAGYSSAELYAFTWGPADPSKASEQVHSRKPVTRVRAFLEAVLEYTGASKVDIISHSMGVTLSRKAVAGGPSEDSEGKYDVGTALTAKVDAFVGIAGANLGLTACYFAPAAATCNRMTGFHPGDKVGAAVTGRSAFLDDLLAHPHAEGTFVASIWSPGDDIIGYKCIVWGENTSQLPKQDAEVELDASMGHMDARNKSTAQQIALVSKHKTQ